MHSPSAILGGSGAGGFAQPIGNLCVSLLCLNRWVPRRFSFHSISTSMSVSTEINHTSLPVLDSVLLRALCFLIQGQLCILDLDKGSPQFSGNPDSSILTGCSDAVQVYSLNLYSISGRSIRRILSRLVIILPAGIRTYLH